MEADVNTKTIPTLASVTGETLGVPRMPTIQWWPMEPMLVEECGNLKA
jgi:hypothetical protein